MESGLKSGTVVLDAGVQIGVNCQHLPTISHCLSNLRGKNTSKHLDLDILQKQTNALTHTI